MANSKINTILKEALAEIKPEKKKISEVDDFVGKINSRIKKLKIAAKAVVGGSFAKDTFLKEDHDVDIFVMFSLKYRDDDLSRMLRKVLLPFKPETLHGSRDYFRAKNRFNFEIVPVLDIKKPEQAQNVTDFSPAHVKWVKKNAGKLRDDIRLAKKFCKSNKVYGAESYIRGFSGHVLDIIIIYYRGFLPLLRAAAKWKPKQVIDFYNVHKGRALFELNKSKTQSSLIVVDPVQPGRNASAALMDEKFSIFAESARKFLKNPSKDFFIEKKADIKLLEKKGAVLVDVESKKGKEDIVGAKLLKAFQFIRKGLDEFRIMDAGWEWDRKKNAVFWFLPGVKRLPEAVEWEGPPTTMKNRVNEFKKKYKKTFIKKGRIYAKRKRKHTKPGLLARDLIKQQYFMDKVKKAKIR